RANEAEFRGELERSEIPVDDADARAFSYRFRGVAVDAGRSTSPDAIGRHVERRIRELRPDRVLVNDDKIRVLLRAALAAGDAERVVLLLQTVTNAPFGLLAVAPDAEQTQRMHEARAVLAISGLLPRYLARYGGPQSA